MARYRRVDHHLKESRERKYRLRAGGPRGVVKFIPNSDSEFAHMARNFVWHIEKHAERLPLSKEQVANLSAAVDGFRDALSQTMRPRSCGPFATMQKNEARKKAEQIIREVANLLRPHQSLTAVDRFALNLNERPKKTKRRECPQIAPVLEFKGSTNHYGSAACGGPGTVVKHVLTYGNDFDRGSSAKPAGAVRLELFVDLVPPELAAAGKLPQHPGELRGGQPWYLRSFTTGRFEVEVPMLSDGSAALVCYWGRWADSRGGVGPFSRTCVARVEGGAIPTFALPGAQRKALIVEQQPQQLEAMERRIVIESGARYVLPERIESVAA